MRPPFHAALDLGRIPDESEASRAELERWQTLLAEMPAPQDADEARTLAEALPDEAAFGLEWTVVHLLERTPGWPVEEVVSAVRSPVLSDVLRDRARG